MKAREIRKLNDAYQNACRFIRAGDLEGLRALLEEDPRLANWRDHPDGAGMQNTLLHEVTGMGEVSWTEQAAEIATLLIEFGAEVNAGERLEGGETPLHHAVSVNNVEVASVLLKAGAEPEKMGRYHNRIDTALGYALFYGLDPRLPRFRRNAPDLLLDFGARLKIPFAAAMGRIRELQAFFDPNRSPMLPDQTYLNQALLFAAKYGRIDVAEFLLAQGADINTRIPFFQHLATPLHLASEQGNRIRMVSFLLQHGARRDIRDGRYDSTPEGWAMFCGQDEVFKMLRQGNA